MKCYILFAIPFLFIPLTMMSQAAFVGHFPGSGYGGITCVEADASGNIFTGGGFSLQMDADPGSGVQMTSADSDGAAWVSKYSSTGQLIWSHTFEGTGNQDVFDLDIDEFGNIYILGWFQNTVDFDPGTGVANLTSVGDYDLFVLKLDQNGNLIQVRSVSGTGRQFGYQIECNGNGHFYISGAYADPTDISLDNSGYILNNAAGNFIAKYNHSGNLIWVNEGTGYIPEIEVETINNEEYVYMATYCKLGSAQSIDIDPSSNFTGLTYNGSSLQVLNSLITVRYDAADGHLIWANFEQAYGVPRQGFDIVVGDIACDLNGYPVITGVFEKNFSGFPGNQMSLNKIDSLWNDVFVVKYHSGGNLLWERKIGSYNQSDWGNDIMIDGSNNVWITGQYNQAPCEFNFTGPSVIASNAGNNDGFVVVYSEQNQYLWHGTVSGPGNQAGGFLTVSGNQIIHGGHFFGSADCDITSGTSLLTAQAASDAFLTLFSQPLSTGTAEHTSFTSELFPNPVNEDSQLKLITVRSGHFTISLNDILGRTVRQIYEGQLEAGTHLFSTNLADVSPGVYHIIINHAAGIRSVQAVVK